MLHNSTEPVKYN